MRIGVLSDTHGLLRPSVVDLLADCDHLLHAGDVGDAEILKTLRQLGPLTAVRGNTDVGQELARLPDTVRGKLDGLEYGMVHRREDVPAAWRQSCRLVVFGHSHRPELEWHGNTLLLNPGACGHRRFRLPLTVAWVNVLDGGERLVPEIFSVED